MTKGRVLAALAVAITGLVISQTFVGQKANAQYPPPQGSMVCIISSSSSTSLIVTVTVRDTAGKTISGQAVHFSVDGDAKLSNYSASTNGSGQASTTIFAGSFAGGIKITANTDDLECSALAEVLAVSTFRPPSTGDAGLLDQGNEPYVMLGGLTLTLLAVALLAASLKRVSAR